MKRLLLFTLNLLLSPSLFPVITGAADNGYLYTSSAQNNKLVTFVDISDTAAVAFGSSSNTDTVSLINRDSSGNWGSAKNFSAPNANALGVAMNSSGKAVALWSSYDMTTSKSNLYASYYNSQTWSSENEITTSEDMISPTSQSFSTIALNDNGDVIIVWQNDNLNIDTTTIFAATGSISSGSLVFNEPIALTISEALDVSLGNVSINNIGDGIFVWNEGGNAYVRIYSKSSDTWAATTLLSIEEYGKDCVLSTPNIAFNDSGEAIACWNNDPTTELYFSVLSSSTWIPYKFLTSSSKKPVVALNNNSQAIVAAFQCGGNSTYCQGTSPAVIYLGGLISDEGLNIVSRGVVPGSDIFGKTVRNLAIALNEQGRAVISWTTSSPPLIELKVNFTVGMFSSGNNATSLSWSDGTKSISSDLSTYVSINNSSPLPSFVIGVLVEQEFAVKIGVYNSGTSHDNLFESFRTSTTSTPIQKAVP